jgi:glycerol-1-phosphate dehydrogenase [NAD(P)+]
VVAQELGFSDEEFVRAVGFAPETRPGRYTILEHLALSPSGIGTAYAEYVTMVTG